MHPDLFITIAFVSIVVAAAIAALFFALHVRRTEAATAELDAAQALRPKERPTGASE